MKNICKILIIGALLLESSCAMMFNSKEVEVAINSNPSGAYIYIDGQNYGKTPATLYIEPKNYQVTLSKPGYGSTQIQLDTWQAIRRKQGDGSRCVADLLGSMLVVPFYSVMWSVYCRDFKQPEYSGTIPYLGKKSAGISRSGSMIGTGQNPADMIPYYYNQEMSQQQGSAPTQRKLNDTPVASGPSGYSEFAVGRNSADEERMQEMQQRMMMNKAPQNQGAAKSESMPNAEKNQADMINYYYQQDMKNLGGNNVEPNYMQDPESFDDRTRSVTGQPELLYQ